MSRPLPFSEQELLRKTAEGDAVAFGQVYDFYYNRIYTFALHLLKTEVLAEEVVQETFLRFWKQGEKLIEVKNIESFLVAVARNKGIDLLRHTKLVLNNQKEQASDWEEAHNETEERLVLKETRKIIEDAIERLPAQQKAVYRLCHQDGLKYEEAAKELGLSVFTVQSYMKLALKNLRQRLGNHPDLLVLLIIFKLF